MSSAGARDDGRYGNGAVASVPGPGAAPPAVPAHLRRFVVEQDYDRYTSIDHAVWRFILLQMHSRLVATAHPVYAQGLAATGISVERIPRIEEMNEKLSRFGWGAVCVDGFVPPRAFQELQAHGILPIAAEMRTLEHLVYTPAPDIVHEAAGHAPILPDPGYAAYLRRIGELGARAFTIPEENRVFDAINTLSRVREDPASGPADAVACEDELRAAIAAVPAPSEATRLSRLYWWTAEYGLVGRVDDYKLYGAGLLSSLGESHSCHAPSVLKLPLDEGCLDVAYDITRAQPQLFVTPSFEALHDVLARVERGTHLQQGGPPALAAALRSQRTASLRFEGGDWVVGVVVAAGPGAITLPAWLAFPAGARLVLSEGQAPRRFDGPVWGLTGPLANGHMLSRATDVHLDDARDPTTGLFSFVFASGARATGRLVRRDRATDGRLTALHLVEAHLEVPDEHGTSRVVTTGELHLVPLGVFQTARGGAIDGLEEDEETGSAAGAVDVALRPRVPRQRVLSLEQSSLLALYQRAEMAAREPQSDMVAVFAAVRVALARAFPNEWLLRWNLLESLLRSQRERGAANAAGRALAEELAGELRGLEGTLHGEQPIASGLRYLGHAAGDGGTL